MEHNDKPVVRKLDPVDFHGQALTVIDRGGEPFVAMRPIVEGMGLAWQPQHRKMTDDSDRFCVTMTVTQMPGDDQMREVTTMPLRKLPGWLMTLQPSRMDGPVAERVLIYQRECDDALWAYWSKGVAVNPRAALPADPTALGLPNFNDPLDAADAWVKQGRQLRASEATVKQLAAQAVSDAPRVAFAAAVEAAPDTYLVGNVAKIIQQGTGEPCGQNRLYVWLREWHYLHGGGDQKNEPTQRSLDAGWFVIQERVCQLADGRERVTRTTRVTGKGKLHLYAAWAKIARAHGRTPGPCPEDAPNDAAHAAPSTSLVATEDDPW